MRSHFLCHLRFPFLRYISVHFLHLHEGFIVLYNVATALVSSSFWVNYYFGTIFLKLKCNCQFYLNITAFFMENVFLNPKYLFSQLRKLAFFLLPSLGQQIY